MSILEGAITQTKVWSAYLRLSHHEEAERSAAIDRLVSLGKQSIPTLQFALKPPNAWKVQCSAAVALHRLQQPEGMAFLIEALRWKVSADPENNLLPDVETAFLKIGVPDASIALLGVWSQHSDWRSENIQVITICKLWAVLCDPRVLDALCQQANYIPDLFEQTVPPFGQMAIPHLARMLRDPDMNRRLLAIQTLRHIHVGDSFTTLVPLLRDPAPEIRSAVPSALYECGPQEVTKREIQEALKAGYSSAEAIQCLVANQPVQGFLDVATAEIFLQILERWNPHSLSRDGDTSGAVLAILPTLSYAPLPTMYAASALCNLLLKKPGGTVSAEIAKVFSVRPDMARIEHGSTQEVQAKVYNALLELLSSTDPKARAEAANALLVRNDTLGQKLLELLEQHRPKGNILAKFQSMIRGGQEAGQIATQAVQQVTQWLNKVSREAFEKQKVEQERLEVLGNLRTFGILHSLLQNTQEGLNRALNTEEITELLSTSVAAIKLLSLMEPSLAKSGQPALLRALYTVKIANVSTSTLALQNQEMREVGHILRTAAAEALFQIYGQDSFVLLLEALYAPTLEVRGTAITALGRLGEVRALPHLQVLANNIAHPLSTLAQEAIGTIKKVNPHYMTLLRPSSANNEPVSQLLRPILGSTHDHAHHELLRPTQEPPQT